MRFLIINLITLLALSSCNYFDKKAIGNIEFGVSTEEFQQQKEVFLSDKKLNDSVYNLNGYFFNDIEGEFYKDQLYRIKIKHIPSSYKLFISPANYQTGKRDESLEYLNIDGNDEVIHNLIMAFDKKYSKKELDSAHEYKYPDIHNQVRLGVWDNYFKNIVLYAINIPTDRSPGYDINKNIYNSYKIDNIEFFSLKRELIDTLKVYKFDSYNLEIDYNPILKEMDKEVVNEKKNKIDNMSKDL